MGLKISTQGRVAAVLLPLALCAAQVDARTPAPRLGVELGVEAAHASDSVIWPDGRGLPAGSGSVAEGRAIFAQRCVACHGEAGRGGPGGELAGGNPDLTRDQPDQTIGTYWPYATTLFDFVRRAMPLDAPWSLSDDEVYATVAYLLHVNGLLDEPTRLDARRLMEIRMPNRDGFDAIEGPTSQPRTER